MAKGISIHIGLNHIDEDYYGTDGELFGCINDANDMKAIATKLGYSSSEILTEDDATKANVVSAICSAASNMASGDTLLLTYSGHGSQVDDVDSDETDAMDETWCLYDQMLVDDELRQMWSQFKAGTRIFMLSDSCHSGTVARMLILKELAKLEPVTRSFLLRRKLPQAAAKTQIADAARALDEVPDPVFRLLPLSARDHVRSVHGGELDAAQYLSGGARAVIQTTLIQISGCQDYQTSLDGAGNGLFTEKLKAVWNNGGFTGGYRKLHEEIVKLMPATQTPNYDVVGAANAGFEAAKPFTIAAAAAPVTTTPATTASGRPVITPLQDTLSVGDAAPSFSVNPGSGKAYAIQWSTDPSYLYSTEGRVWKENYFSTISKMPRDYSGSYPVEVTMPQDAWEGLSAEGDRLYYRLWRADSRNGPLTNSSAPSENTVPYVPISGEREVARARGKSVAEQVSTRGVTSRAKAGARS
jgi:metacaspase-1